MSAGCFAGTMSFSKSSASGNNSSPETLASPHLFGGVFDWLVGLGFFPVRAWVLQAPMLQGGKSNKQVVFLAQMSQFQSHCWGEQRRAEITISRASSHSWEMLEVANPFPAFPLRSLACGCTPPSQKNWITMC